MNTFKTLILPYALLSGFFLNASNDSETTIYQYKKDLKDLAKDQATLGRDQATLSKDQAILVRDQATLSKDQAILVRDQATLSKDQATLSKDQATLSKDQATLSKDQANLARQLARKLNLGCDTTRANLIATAQKNAQNLTDLAYIAINRPAVPNKELQNQIKRIIYNLEYEGRLESETAENSTETDETIDSYISK